MESFMILLCRKVYNVQSTFNKEVLSFLGLGCLDSDRDINAALNIKHQGIVQLKAAGLSVSVQ